VPVAAFVAFLAVYVATVSVRSPASHGPVLLHVVPVVVASPLLLVGAVAFAVALGSWVRFGVAPIAAVVAIGFLSVRLATAGDPGWNGLSALSTVGPQADSPLLISLLPTWSYLAWVVALTCAVAAVALLRHGMTTAVALTGGGAVVLGLLATVTATAPVDAGEASRVAALIADPAAHQTCTDGPVPVCTFADYRELRQRIAREVGPVVAALPAGAPHLTVRQAFDGNAADLPGEVLERLDSGVPRQPSDEVWIGSDARPDVLLSHRLRVAFAALGLSLGDEADQHPQSVSGQARGVVALWLASRGMDLADALALATGQVEGDAFDRGVAWPTMCGPVVWSAQDLVAARALIAAPEAEVAAVVADGFERWADRRTGTDELLAAAGLPSAGPYDRVVPRTEDFC
jgi:hypothetical protein